MLVHQVTKNCKW